MLEYRQFSSLVSISEGSKSSFSVAAPDDQQPLEGSEGGNLEQNSPNASTAPQVTIFRLIDFCGEKQHPLPESACWNEFIFVALLGHNAHFQMFNPTLVPPAPEAPAVPDGSQSGEVRPAVLVSRFTRYLHATTELCSKTLTSQRSFACMY